MAQLDTDLLTWIKSKFYQKTEVDDLLTGKSDNGHTHPTDNSLSTTSTNAVANNIITDELNNKAPTSHASTGTSYGVGSASNYGHVKVDSALSTTSTNTVQNKAVTTELNNKAPTSHASTGTSYGVASTSNYGHVKVDSALSTTSTNTVQNKAVSTALNNKVDKVNGKSLVLDSEITKLSHVADYATYNAVDTSLSTTSTNAVQNKIITSEVNAKAPTNHASTGTSYGVGSTSNYGHVKTINALNQASHSDGTALSAYQGKILKDLVDSKAPGTHTHTGTELRLGSSGADANVTIQESVNSKATGTHTHGNIKNDGSIGSTANLPLITTTSGKVTTGSFGNTANTFCQGNDSRLSNNRTPTSHASTSTTYGVGSPSNYGHVKTINALNQTNHVDGNALSAYQGSVLNSKITEVSNNSHYKLRFGTSKTAIINPWNITLKKGTDLYVSLANKNSDVINGAFCILEINGSYYYHNMTDGYANRTINLNPGTYYIKAYSGYNSEFLVSGLCRLTVTA